MDAKQLQDEADKARAEATRVHQLADREAQRSSAHAKDGDETRANLEDGESRKLADQAATLEKKAVEASENAVALVGLAAKKKRERDAYKAESEKKLDDMDREIRALTGGSMML